MLRVAVRVQAHPSRSELHRELLRSLEPLPTELSLHASDPPSPWEGYQLALRSGLEDPTDPTHLLVLQDDVALCRNLPRAVTRIAEVVPDAPVVLFLSWLPRGAATDVLVAAKEGARFVRFRPSKFIPVVGILWPRACIERFLDWSSTAILPGYPNRVHSDDACVGEWQRRTQETVWITVPSLVQHPDNVDSTIGRQAHWGADRGRTALMFCEGDPLEYDWSPP